MFPKFEVDGSMGGREGRLAQLKLEKRKYERGLDHMKHTIRNLESATPPRLSGPSRWKAFSTRSKS